MIPVNNTQHPRLLITNNDLPKLRSWASLTNPVYKNGIMPLIASLEKDYLTRWFPNGVPATNFPDNGDTNGYTPTNCVEMLAVFFAFNALIDPDTKNRIKYAKYARNLIMYGLSQAALGPAPMVNGVQVPFRDKLFAVSNRMNFGGELWAFVLDWLYDMTDENGTPIFSAADKATARMAFLNWCKLAYVSGEAPYPIGVYNNPAILPGTSTDTYGYPNRYTCNNYAIVHMRTLTLFGLMLDDVDDQPIDSTKSADIIGNSVRSYLKPALQGWLYRLYAQFGEPNEIAKEYNISNNKLGWASGGLPMEGCLYGESIQWLLTMLCSMQTAGCSDVNVIGPQAKMLTIPYWDRFVPAFVSLLSQTPIDLPYGATNGYLKQTYFYVGAYGDLLRRWCTADVFKSYAMIALMQQRNGQMHNYEAARWATINMMPGGNTALYSRISKPYQSFLEPILQFMLLDPTLPAPTDPRKSWPIDFVDPMQTWANLRTGWSANDSILTYRSCALGIGHQQQDGGGWQLFRKGELLTGFISNYKDWGQFPTVHNTLSIKNWCANGTPKGMLSSDPANWVNGGQFHGYEDPKTTVTTGNGYKFIDSDITALYNRKVKSLPDNAVDVLMATRSILWIHDDASDVVITYSRVKTGHPNFKIDHICFGSPTVKPLTPPVVSGNVVSSKTIKGQNVSLQTVLPVSATVSVNYGILSGSSGDMETMAYVASIEDASKNPIETRFLTVFQGTDGAMIPATLVQSTSGTNFDGVVFGQYVVLFKNNPTDVLVPTTITVPTTVTKVFISGLEPNANYGINLANGILTIEKNTFAVSDSAGLLKL